MGPKAASHSEDREPGVPGGDGKEQSRFWARATSGDGAARADGKVWRRARGGPPAAGAGVAAEAKRERPPLVWSAQTPSGTRGGATPLLLAERLRRAGGTGGTLQKGGVPGAEDGAAATPAAPAAAAGSAAAPPPLRSLSKENVRPGGAKTPPKLDCNAGQGRPEAQPEARRPSPGARPRVDHRRGRAARRKAA